MYVSRKICSFLRNVAYGTLKDTIVNIKKKKKNEQKHVMLIKYYPFLKVFVEKIYPSFNEASALRLLHRRIPPPFPPRGKLRIKLNIFNECTYIFPSRSVVKKRR